MYPFVFAAGAVGVYFTVAALQLPHPAKILAAVLWTAYAVYEYYVANGTLCDANCNIRVDLLLFFPVLAFASIVAAQAEPRPVVVTILYAICLGLVALIAAVLGYPGSKPIEFEKGKAAIMLPNKGALVATFDTVIAAVRAGELDEILALQAKARVMPRAKRIA